MTGSPSGPCTRRRAAHALTAVAALLALLLAAPTPASAGDTMTPGELLQKLFPRVPAKNLPGKNQPKRVRKATTAPASATAKPAEKPAEPTDTATLPTPRAKPQVEAAVPVPAKSPEAPTPEPARNDTRPIVVGTLAEPLGAEALAFAPPTFASPLELEPEPEPARPVDPGESPLGIVLPPKAGLPGAIEGDTPAEPKQAEDGGPPLPRSKPEVQLAAIILPRPPQLPGTLAACRSAMAALQISAKTMPAVQEGACGAPDPYSVSALQDGSVKLEPAATINCETASTLSTWISSDVQSAAIAAYGGRVTAIRVLDSYSCRGRNQIAGAPLSEHAFMNAIDVGAFEIGGRWVTVEKGKDHTDKDTDFIQTIRHKACDRFLTVLGPGSDGYHENHLHLDMRHRGKHGDSVYCH